MRTCDSLRTRVDVGVATVACSGWYLREVDEQDSGSMADFEGGEVRRSLKGTLTAQLSCWLRKTLKPGIRKRLQRKGWK